MPRVRWAAKNKRLAIQSHCARVSVKSFWKQQLSVRTLRIPGAGSRAMSTLFQSEPAIASGITGGAPLLVNDVMKSLRFESGSPVLNTPPVAVGNLSDSSAFASGSRSSPGIAPALAPLLLKANLRLIFFSGGSALTPDRAEEPLD